MDGFGIQYKSGFKGVNKCIVILHIGVKEQLKVSVGIEIMFISPTPDLNQPHLNEDTRNASSQ